MSKSTKLYIFIALLSLISFSTFSTDSNIYENQVASTVCEGDSNIIKAGCSVAVGQVVRVTPGIVTGVTFDKMGECFNKYGPTIDTTTTNGQATTTIEAKNKVIDLNDPCNQIATLNPKMQMQNFAYIPYDPVKAIANSRPSIASLATYLEVTNQQATNGLLMNRAYAMGETFKNVPYLKTTFAQSVPKNSLDAIAGFVFKVWQVSRNFAYLVLLIGSLFLGITIMIGNQTIDKDGKIRLTVEKAIPRVVIAVILISSSYWVGELVLNSLVGGGIVSSFASFFASAVFPSQTSYNYAQFISYSAVILMMGIVSGMAAASGGGALIPIIFAILAAVWRLILLNIYIAKNILDLLIYIMVSPFYIVGGVLPNENKSLIFKRYVSSLLKFILNGFLLNLIAFGSKAILIFGSLQFVGMNETDSVIYQIAHQYTSSLANIVIYIFSIWAFIHIIGLANQTDAYSTKLAQSITGTKPDTKKEE